MGIWRSRQTTSLRGNRLYRRPERAALLRSISFSTSYPELGPALLGHADMVTPRGGMCIAPVAFLCRGYTKMTI